MGWAIPDWLHRSIADLLGTTPLDALGRGKLDAALQATTSSFLPQDPNDRSGEG